MVDGKADRLMDAAELTPEQEAAVMDGSLQVKVAGVTRRLPVLPRKPAREWRALWRERLAAETSAEDIGRSFGEAAELTGDTLLDLIVAYDQTGSLGTRDELDATATDREIRAIYDAIAEEAFAPLVQAGLAPLLGMALIEAIALRQASYIATRSSAGELALPNSTPSTPNPKSPSSGRKTRPSARKSSARA
jgi:hypothetical protein